MKLADDIETSMNETSKLDRCILNLQSLSCGANGAIIVFVSADFKFDCVDPMLREPAPMTGQEFDKDFFVHFDDALSQNNSIHDGAIILKSNKNSSAYRVWNWSCRIFAPQIKVSPKVPNRGSAFNSALAIAAVTGVDVAYYWSGDEVWKFSGSNFKLLAPADELSK